ncbi:relaxase/mobilization nuclease domain-containing protein [Aminobacterium mobile]
MKPKTVRGSGFRGLLDYQFRIGKPPETRAKAKMIGGNMAGENPRELSKEFGQARKLRTDIKKPVWHCSLNLPAGEILDETKWREVVDSFLEKMEVDPSNQFCIIRHRDTNYDHVHIALNRVNFGGRVWSYANDVYRAIDACQKLEKEFNLTLTPGFNRRKKNDNTPKLTYREMQMISRTGEPSAKMKIKSVLDSLFSGGKTYTPQEFCQALQTQGITPIPNIARTGKMNGFAFRFGEIEVKAGKCGWPWKKMEKYLEMSELGITYLQQKREENMKNVELQRENLSDATGTEGEAGAKVDRNNRANRAEFDEHERKLVSTPEIVDESRSQNSGGSVQRGARSEERNRKIALEKNHIGSGIPGGNSAWDGVLDTVSVLARNSLAPVKSADSRRHVKKSVSVQKKEAAWQEQSAALGAEFYRITLVERGPAARRMNVGKGKGENGKEKFYTAEEVKNMIPKLEFWNAKKNDIYVTPIDADYHFILIDDLPLEGKRYVEENYAPVLIQTSSRDNWQAVLKVSRKENTKEEQSAANELMRRINVEVGGDSKISAVVHPFRLAGFQNKKPNRENEYTRIIAANPGAISLRASEELEKIRRERKAEAEKVERERRENAIRTTNIRENRNIVRPQDETILDFHFREIWGKNQRFARKMIENGKWQEIDYSAIDFRVVRELLQRGYEPEKIEEALLKCSPELASRHSGDYAFKTIQAALDSLYREQERKQNQPKKNEMEVEQFWEPTL